MTYPEADDDIYASIYQKLVNELENWTGKIYSDSRSGTKLNAIKTQIPRPKVSQITNNYDVIPIKYNGYDTSAAPAQNNGKSSPQENEPNFMGKAAS